VWETILNGSRRRRWKMQWRLVMMAGLVLAAGCGEKKPDVSLRDAAERGDISTVRQLLVSGYDVNARDEGGGTALHAAAFRGDVEMIKLLIVKGADINVADRDGDTPLDFAKDADTARAMREAAEK